MSISYSYVRASNVQFATFVLSFAMFTHPIHIWIPFLFLLNLDGILQCPMDEIADTAKAAYKSGEVPEPSAPITLQKIKTKLKDAGIFDEEGAALTEMEKKELKKLYDVVEIMTSSRNRQPQSVQNGFSYLRLVERVVNKQHKEGQISDSLAAKFHWEKLSESNRQKRETPINVANVTTQMTEITNQSESNRQKRETPINVANVTTQMTEITNQSESNRQKRETPINVANVTTQMTEITNQSESNRQKRETPINVVNVTTQMTEITNQSESNRQKRETPINVANVTTQMTEITNQYEK